VQAIGNILTLLNVQLDDRGLYTCSVKNSAGEDSSWATLEVERKYYKILNIISSYLVERHTQYPTGDVSLSVSANSFWIIRK